MNEGRYFRKHVCVFLVCLLSSSISQPATASRYSAEKSIEIVYASFGSLKRTRKLDIAPHLKSFCGADAKSCSVFCSETSFGRYQLGKRPICRVIYRCGPGEVRTVEAEREEPILMRCPEEAEPQPVYTAER